jgi:transposase
VVCIRLSGRVSGPSFDREFDLEQEEQRPGAGARGSLVERRQRAEIQELKLALAEATVQLRIWQKGSEYVGQVPSQTSRP